MARKVVKTVVLDEELDLSGILKNLSPDGNWSVKIFRREGGSDSWISTMAPADVTEEHIAQKHGAGRYLVRPYNDASQKWGPSKVVSISNEAEGLPATTAPAPAESSGNLQIEMMKLQMSMQKESADRQFQMMQQFNTSMMGILTAVIGAQKPQDFASIVSVVKELNPKNSIADVREMVKLAKEISPAGEGGSDDVTTSLLTMGMKLLEARATAAPRVPVPDPQPGGPPMANPPNDGRAPAAEVDGRRALLTMLKSRAAAGKDPKFYADYLDDNDDDPACRWILEAVQAYEWPQLKAGLLSVDADLANEPYASWFEALYRSLVGVDAEGTARRGEGGGDGKVDS